MGMFNRNEDSHKEEDLKHDEFSLQEIIQSPYISFVLGLFAVSFLFAEKAYDYTSTQQRTLDLIQDLQVNVESLKVEIGDIKNQRSLTSDEHKKDHDNLDRKLDRIEFKIIELEQILEK